MLVQGISNDKNALGYFGFAYYAENPTGLGWAVAIDGGKGPVTPSAKTVEDGSYQPLARPIFIYVSKKAATKPEVKEYVEFYLKQAAPLVKQVTRAAAAQGLHRSRLSTSTRARSALSLAARPERLASRSTTC